MAKELILFDIKMKILKLHHDYWYNLYIKVISLFALLEIFNLIVGLTLKYLFNIKYAVILCATIPNLLICMVLSISAYMFQKKYKKIQALRYKIDKCLDLLAYYDNYSYEDNYKKFQQISEINIPDIGS